jgi:AcrR family transcriptional regulator
MELNENYKGIMQKGKELFWKYGIKKVSVEEICQKVPVSRVTFYKYFNGKEDLALKILKDILELSLKEYRDIMDSDLSFEEKLEKTIVLKMKYTDHFSHEYIHDVYSGAFPRIKEYLMENTVEVMKMIENEYREAQEKGFIRQDLKFDFIMYMINHTQTLIQDPQLIKQYNDSGDMIYDLIQFLFYGIVSRQNKQ